MTRSLLQRLALLPAFLLTVAAAGRVTLLTSGFPDGGVLGYVGEGVVQLLRFTAKWGSPWSVVGNLGHFLGAVRTTVRGKK